MSAMMRREPKRVTELKAEVMEELNLKARIAELESDLRNMRLLYEDANRAAQAAREDARELRQRMF